MRRRAVIALALGGVLTGGAMVSLGPVVRAQVRERAERYGAKVTIDRVRPSWSGIRLLGVDATLPAVPGLHVHSDELLVGWDRRPRRLDGTKITAEGSLDRLASDLQAWREETASPASPTPAGAGPSNLDLIRDVEVAWSEVEGGSRNIQATGVTIRRREGIEVAATTLRGNWDTLQAEGEGASVRLVKDGGGSYRVQAIASRRLDIDVHLDVANAAALSSPTSGTPQDVVHRSPDAKGDEIHPRVAKARRLHGAVRRAAMALHTRIDPDLQLALHGVTIRLDVAGDRIAVGPGSVRWSERDGDLVVGLAPPVADPNTPSGLTFLAHVPLSPHDGHEAATRPIAAELKGGPLSLALLGVRERDFHLIDVPRATVQVDARIELAGDGSTIVVDGRGRIDDLSLESPSMAPAPLEDVDLAWRGKVTAHVDGSRVETPSLEVDLGKARLLLHGHLQRPAGQGIVTDLRFEVPLVSCQDGFDAIPDAMVPHLEGIRFAGSVAATGHVRFDTRDLAKHFDVDWSGTLGCRVVATPPKIDVARFKKRFDKTVYDAGGAEKMMEFGPETPRWTPLTSISQHMVSAVLTTEDGRFFRHRGFDQEAIVNSLKDNLIAGRFRRGASTISMQLAKNLYLKRTKTISRKLEEAILTIYLEQSLTKEEMMELYLNVIEYGPMVYGIGPATQHYFRTHPGRLALSQALYLSSILPNPKKQHFGAGGAVTAGYMRYLRRLMEIVHKIGRISDEELEHGQRETVVFGSPSPMVAPPDDDPYEDLAPAPQASSHLD